MESSADSEPSTPLSENSYTAETGAGDQCGADTSSQLKSPKQVDCNDLATISSHNLLSDEQKYQILTSTPHQLNVYPLNSQKRRFQPRWMEDFPWIRYSLSADGVFCAPCFLFSKSRFNAEFVSSPFRDWKNATGKSRGALYRHSSSCGHLQCNEQAVTFLAVTDKKTLSIKSQLSASYDKQNTGALLSVIDVIQFPMNQDLALRGHHWNKGIKREDGNFSTLIDFVAKYNSDLNSHLHSSARNARYLSPKIQNELISINGDLIRKSIVEECNASLFWSVMVDEGTDVSTTEQASICVRYVSVKGEKLEVCEEFLGFCSIPSTDVATITSAIVTFMVNCGLNMSTMIGKGFDGASNMSGHISGVSQQPIPQCKIFHSLSKPCLESCCCCKLQECSRHSQFHGWFKGAHPVL